MQGVGVPILGNSIYQNAVRGIDLNGVAPAIDHCDVDGGANGQQGGGTHDEACAKAGLDKVKARVK